jgi:glycerol-3-phosphate dehydrogenase
MTGQSFHVQDGYDVAVIGAGVVGCAVFREFVLAGARTVLIERDADIIGGASKGNSAILHTGFDAMPGSLEAACVQEGYRAYQAVHRRLNLPLLQTGALVIAWNEQELAALPGILAQARENGVEDVAMLGAEAVLAREPGLSRSVRGAVLVPGESIIDPWSAPLAYALQGQANGGTVLLQTEVTGGILSGDAWTLQTRHGRDSRTVKARVAINCAGNYGDLVETIARPSPFTIRPRKGQFVVFDKPASALAHAIILPVPTERTKGVVITRTVFGNLLVGPTAEDQTERRDATVTETALDMLVQAGIRMLPALKEQAVTTAYAGLRPATEFKDYQVAALPDRRWITAAGIRSTGLTGSLGLARHLRRLHEQHFGAFQPLAHCIWPTVPNLTEELPRPYMQAGRSEIVCHCEQVTRREIAAALEGPLPAGTLGGLRRRTRCMNGRCQGFYCARRVMARAC